MEENENFKLRNTPSFLNSFLPILHHYWRRITLLSLPTHIPIHVLFKMHNFDIEIRLASSVKQLN